MAYLVYHIIVECMRLAWPTILNKGKMMKKSEQTYTNRVKKFSKRQKKTERKAKFVANLRVAIAGAGLILTFVLYRGGNTAAAGLIFVICLVAFILLVRRHNKLTDFKIRLYLLNKQNETALKRIKGEWKTFTDTGREFVDNKHPYSQDLDLFGKGSLFQWVNTGVTYLGRRKLMDILSREPENKEKIIERQEAVRELARKMCWRQRLAVEAMAIPGAAKSPQKLLEWSTLQSEDYTGYIRYTVRILPVITTSMVVAYLAGLNVAAYVPVSLLVIQFLILSSGGKKRSEILNTVHEHAEALQSYREMFRLFEKCSFKASLLNKMQCKLTGSSSGSTGSDNQSACQRINKLFRIAESISNRNNAFFLLFNILLLWDYQCMIALEKWKKASGRMLPRWFETLGELEALCSLSGINFDHPDWTVPQIKEGEPELAGERMGHPLITEGRVSNDLVIKEPATIMLVTGSNMSGKSTFLRTAGINLVLAYSGAAVCARHFECSLMKIYTCMRVSDNLEHNTSSFYAELLRIRMIVEAVKGKQQVFFLLDEIFKGTNSVDRHTGAQLLISQLAKFGAVGLVSTHDLELAQMEAESGGRIKNLHFREHYVNDKITFDYKLHHGVSTTRNAMYLIKLAGIETEE